MSLTSVNKLNLCLLCNFSLLFLLLNVVVNTHSCFWSVRYLFVPESEKYPQYLFLSTKSEFPQFNQNQYMSIIIIFSAKKSNMTLKIFNPNYEQHPLSRIYKRRYRSPLLNYITLQRQNAHKTLLFFFVCLFLCRLHYFNSAK